MAMCIRLLCENWVVKPAIWQVPVQKFYNILTQSRKEHREGSVIPDICAFVRDKKFREKCYEIFGQVLIIPGSRFLILVWLNDQPDLTGRYRKKRETGLDGNVFNPIVSSFRADYQTLTLVEVSRQVNNIVDRTVSLYPLRGFDAIHLASAIIIQTNLSERLLFVCFDQRLLDAARAEGLDTFPSV